MPTLPLDPSLWSSLTRRLTAAEKGGLMELVVAAWTAKPKALSREPVDLERLAGMPVSDGMLLALDALTRPFDDAFKRGLNVADRNRKAGRRSALLRRMKFGTAQPGRPNGTFGVKPSSPSVRSEAGDRATTRLAHFETLFEDIENVTGESGKRGRYRRLMLALGEQRVRLALSQTKAAALEDGVESAAALFESRCRAIAGEVGVVLP